MGGPSAFSEPETQAVKKLVEEHNFKIAFNYHSFGKQIYLPYSCKAKGTTPDEVFFRKYAQRLASSNGFHFGQPWNTGLYTVNGDAADWMYSAHQIIAVSPEVAPADPVASEHAGFWVRSELIPKASLETLQMNYIGAWTSGAYLEISDAFLSDQLLFTFKLWNFGLISTEGRIDAVFYLPQLNLVINSDFPINHPPIRAEGFALGSFSNVQETYGKIIIRDNDYCIIYSFNLTVLSFETRIDPNEHACNIAFNLRMNITAQDEEGLDTYDEANNFNGNQELDKEDIYPRNKFLIFGILLVVICVFFLAVFLLYRRKQQSNETVGFQPINQQDRIMDEADLEVEVIDIDEGGEEWDVEKGEVRS